MVDEGREMLATGADTLLSGDLGCLLNIASRFIAAWAPTGARSPCRGGARRRDRGDAADRRRGGNGRAETMAEKKASAGDMQSTRGSSRITRIDALTAPSCKQALGRFQFG